MTQSFFSCLLTADIAVPTVDGEKEYAVETMYRNLFKRRRRHCDAVGGAPAFSSNVFLVTLSIPARHFCSADNRRQRLLHSRKEPQRRQRAHRGLVDQVVREHLSVSTRRSQAVDCRVTPGGGGQVALPEVSRYTFCIA